MTAHLRSTAAGLLVLFLAACGADPGAQPEPTAPPMDTASPTDTDTDTPAPTTDGTDDQAPDDTGAPAPDATEPAAPTAWAQPVVWPAYGTHFEDPTDAATSFVTEVLGVPAVLGDFRAGDNRSGELEVYSQPEEGGRSVLRGTLLLRQVGPGDGWTVLGAVSEGITIDAPAVGTTVPAGVLTVSGSGRGFEAHVDGRAFVAGGAELDTGFTMAGTLGELEPYSIELDLSAAASGDVVTLLVRGGTGLETDPGEFAAVAVVIG